MQYCMLVQKAALFSTKGSTVLNEIVSLDTAYLALYVILSQPMVV